MTTRAVAGAVTSSRRGMRRILPRYREQVPGFGDRWMDPYLERWDYLTSEPAMR